MFAQSYFAASYFPQTFYPEGTTTNVATGGSASDSGINDPNGQGAAQAFDGSAATKWLVFSNTGWLQYQFGSGDAYAVTQYALTVGADTSSYPGRAPKNWTFLGSNDGVSWTTLDTQTNQADTLSGDTRTYSIANTTAYEYYRLNIIANNGDADTQLAELGLFGPRGQTQKSPITPG
jgi:F5/8 type C domain